MRVREATSVLPVLSFREVDGVDSGSNEVVKHLLPVVESKPLRTCNTCFVRAECPAFEEDSTCAYTLPVEVRNGMQRKALIDGVVEIQAQRVAFMRFREELSGGYADPNLSQEIDRLMKIFSTLAEIEDSRDTFKMTVEAKTKAGVLSRLFGRDAGEASMAANGHAMDAVDTDRTSGRIVRGSVE